MVLASPNVIGDFTWTGWDYLGEVGIGATAYAEDPERRPGARTRVPVPHRLVRRPRHHRLAAAGRRTTARSSSGCGPSRRSRCVRPERHGHTVTHAVPWAWSDSCPRGPGRAHEGRPVTVEVVRRRRRGRPAARRRRGGPRTGRRDASDARLARDASTARARSSPSPTATAPRSVARRWSPRRGRRSSPPPRTASTVRATTTPTSPTSPSSCATRPGCSSPARTCRSPSRSRGAGVLAGLGSGNPSTAERFDASTWTTFDGRALAIVRPTGPGPSRSRSRPRDSSPSSSGSRSRPPDRFPTRRAPGRRRAARPDPTPGRARRTAVHAHGASCAVRGPRRTPMVVWCHDGVAPGDVTLNRT